MLSALLGFSCVFAWTIRDEKERENTQATGSRYDFANGRFDDDNSAGYDDNIDFYISNSWEFHEFAVSVAYDYSFEGKNVYLENDIDFSGYGNNFCPVGASMYGEDDKSGMEYKSSHSSFAGNFNGNNFAIENISVNVLKCSSFSQRIELGLFWELTEKAIVQNVRVNGFNVTTTSAASKEIEIVGGIAPIATGATIQNCIIENFSVELDIRYNGSNSAIGGIVGYQNNTTIKNCYVRNFNASTIGGGQQVVYVGGITAVLNDSAVILNSLFVNDSNSLWTSKMNLTTGYIYAHKIKNAVVSVTNTHSEKASAINGLDGLPAWYIPNTNEFNDGWPYLKSFLKIYSVVSYGNGSFSCDSLAVFRGEEITITPDNVHSKTLVTSGGTIHTNPDEGYTFRNWKVEDLVIYGTFGIEIYKIQFENIEGVSPLVYNKLDLTETTGNNVINCYYQEKIILSQTFNRSETLIKFENERFIVEYYVDNKYMLDNSGLSSILDNNGVVKDLGIDAVTIVISPSVILKAYGVAVK